MSDEKLEELLTRHMQAWAGVRAELAMAQVREEYHKAALKELKARCRAEEQKAELIRLTAMRSRRG